MTWLNVYSTINDDICLAYRQCISAGDLTLFIEYMDESDRRLADTINISICSTQREMEKPKYEMITNEVDKCELEVIYSA